MTGHGPGVVPIAGVLRAAVESGAPNSLP